MHYYWVIGEYGPALLHAHRPCVTGCEQVNGSFYEHRFSELSDLAQYIDDRVIARTTPDTFGPPDIALPIGYRDLTKEERMQADTRYAQYIKDLERRRSIRSEEY